MRKKRGRFILQHPSLDDFELCCQEAKRISDLFRTCGITMRDIIIYRDDSVIQLDSILSVAYETDEDLERYVGNRMFSNITYSGVILLFDVEFSFSRRVLDVNFLAAIKLSLPDEYTLRTVNV